MADHAFPSFHPLVVVRGQEMKKRGRTPSREERNTLLYVCQARLCVRVWVGWIMGTYTLIDTHALVHMRNCHPPATHVQVHTYFN